MSSNPSQPMAGVGWKRPRTATPHGRHAAHAHAATSAQSTLGQQDPPTHRDREQTRRTHARDREHKDQSQPARPFKRPANQPTLHGAHTRTDPQHHQGSECVARLRPSLAQPHQQGTHERTHARSHPWSHAPVFGSSACHVTDCASVRSSGTRVPAASSSPRQRPPPPPSRGPTRARCKGLRPTPALLSLGGLRLSRPAVVGSSAPPRSFFPCRGFRLVCIHDSYSSGAVNTVPGRFQSLMVW
jgi:hypothetical protein